jgi:curved DNA-binding protein CbpA
VNIPDPYKILQVDPEAEDEVIEAAYKRLARKYHPDVSAGPDAQERMARINQAWEMLRSPVRRAAVDRAKARAAAQAARASATEARAKAGGGRRSGTGGRAGREPGGPGWPFPGMKDTAEPGFPSGARPQYTSPDWTPGRSAAGHSYDPTTMRAGAAGPPPGNPAGSVLTFGRYSGWSLAEIARNDLEYLEWLDRMPIGRPYREEIDQMLRRAGRRRSAATESTERRGLFRRR